jgi:adenylate cyclase
MPSIRIHGGETFTTGVLTSLLNALLSHRYPIETLCGGHAECGKCLIKIVSGAQYLSPIHPTEAKKLSSLEAGPGMRLACQCYTRGDVEIEVINQKKPAGDG